MKTFLTNNWVLITAILSFILDEKYKVLDYFITNPQILTIVKGLGFVLVAYFTPKNLGFFKKEAIGGGGIPNPKNPK
jgi:hypothetical protein